MQADPSELGFDPERLARIDRHLQRYVDDGRLAGWQLRIDRQGRLAHASTYGMADKEADRPVADDTLWRIYSMTKPITSVVAMQLVEEGLVQLNDPVSRYLPSFADVRVLAGGSVTTPQTVAVAEPVRLWHLLTHTAGLTYGFTRSSLLDEIYRAAGSDFGNPAGMDLAQLCDLWASLPLLFQPGTAWNYSVATDVLGRVVEVVTGQTLEQAMSERVLRPLGMSDTRWWVDEDDAERLAALYVRNPSDGTALRWDPIGEHALHPPSYFGGGGGLISTAGDYARFTDMLLRGGVGLDGGRVLGPRTLRLMSENHLPRGAFLSDLARGSFAEVGYAGMGFGLGFGVLVDPASARSLSNPGELTWGGAATTAFWVDPSDELSVVFLTQMLPSSTYAVRAELRQLVYAALVD